MHEVRRLTEGFSAHIKRWSAAADSLDRALRQLGEVESFASAVEAEVHELSVLLMDLAASQQAQGEGQQQAASAEVPTEETA